MMWDDEDSAAILGNGSCFGNLTGKVKTDQIGFIRRPKDVRGKSHVPGKGRGQKTPPLRKQKERG